MFLTARILCYNEEDYIWYVMKSVYPAVDSIIVAEGCIKEYGEVADRASREGLSTDRTEQEICRFIDDDDVEKKVQYLRVGFVKNYAELANLALIHFPRKTSHFLNVDADEVYKSEDIQRVKKLFEKFPQLCGVAVNRIHFYLDFYTIRKSRKVIQLEPTGGTMFRKFYPGEYHPEKGAEHNPYLRGHSLMDRWLPWYSQDLSEGISKATNLGFDGITFRERLVDQYHYGWVRKPDKMLERVIQTYRRSNAYSGQHVWRNKSEQELAEFIQLYNPIWTGALPDEDRLLKFKGEHPRVMQTHPFYNMKKEDFGWGTI